MPVLTGQTSDVAQGRYHHHSSGARLKKDSDLDLKVKAGGGGEGEAGGSGREVRAMIEMTEMTSSKADDEEEEDLKGTCMHVHLLCQNCERTASYYVCTYALHLCGKLEGRLADCSVDNPPLQFLVLIIYVSTLGDIHVVG